MPVEDQLGAERCLLQEQHLTSGILVFQPQGLLDESSEARAGTASLSCGARGAAAPSLAGLGARTEIQLSQERCCSSLTLLSPQPSRQWRSPEPHLGKEKIQRDPLVSSSSSFMSFSTFLSPLLNSQLCGMPPPPLHFGSSVSLHKLS